jgi:hypothetical protein
LGCALALDFSEEQDVPEIYSSQLTTRGGKPGFRVAHCSAGNPAPEINPGLKRTRINVKTNFTLKITVIWKYFELQIYPQGYQ